MITICDAGPLVAFLNRNDPHNAFDMSVHRPRIRTLMARYRQMDLADASIVAMSELHARSTVDRPDFSVYRRHDRRVIDFFAPSKR